MASIRKRTWSTAKGKKSAWIVAYLHQGKQHIRTFPTKKAAESWRATMTVERQKGIHVPASVSITVAEAGQRWLDQAMNDGLEASTVAQYRQHLTFHILPHLGDVRLSELTAASIQDFRNTLTKGTDRRRSLATVRKIVISLGSILGHAMALGLASRNVVREAVAHNRRHQRLSGRHTARLEIGRDIPSKEELRAILAHAQGRWRALIVTAIFTGLRASELRGLTWKDVDLEAATLRVRQRADRWNKIGSPKSASSAREVPLAPMVVNALKEWRLACPKGDLGLVFPDDSGNVVALTVIRRQALGKVLVDAGLCADQEHPIYSMHNLRHAAASLFIEQGFTPKKVQALMGHSDIGMTFNVYGHLFPSQDSDAEAMRQLQARLVG
jgi:integrase